MPYSVYLANFASIDEDTLRGVSDTLTRYFNEIDSVTDGDSHSFTGVRIINNTPTLLPADLLCYLVHDFINSVVVEFDSAISTRITDETAGITSVRSHGSSPPIAASEVYIDSITDSGTTRSTSIANLIFHELMHNKSADLSSRIHTHGGGGLAVETLDSSSVLSQRNIVFMRARMGNPVIQWTGGFDANSW